MARRKNTKFIDPRYFMDEKMERLDEAHDTGQGDAPTDEEIKERKTKCTGSGGKWHAGYDKADPSLGRHGHCKCSDGSTSRVGACKKKKLDEYGATPEMQMPEAFVDQPGDEMGQKLWKDAMRHRWEQYLAGDKSAFDQLSPELRKELGLPQ